MDSPLLKYSAKDYFFKAALCHFCIDMLNAKVDLPLCSLVPGAGWAQSRCPWGPSP